MTVPLILENVYGAKSVYFMIQEVKMHFLKRGLFHQTGGVLSMEGPLFYKKDPPIAQKDPLLKKSSILTYWIIK